MKSIKAVLFDLDGTLLDTAQDLGTALNRLRTTHALPTLSASVIREAIGTGARGLLKIGFNIDASDNQYPILCEQFLTFYQEHLLDQTQLFSGMLEVLTFLQEASISWGIVTNKPHRFTQQIVERLGLTTQTSCIISGDSLEKCKPHPQPILHACQLLQCHPTECVFIGDAEIDIMAGKAAGTKTLIAMYGYIPQTENPLLWQADGQIHHPLDIIQWVTSS